MAARKQPNQVTNTVPYVGYIRKELANYLQLYYLIRDCLSGESAIKAAGIKYLPKPSATGDAKEDEARYATYRQRATFYAVTRRTLAGMLGQVFMRPPVVKLPAQLEPIIANATGTGVSLEQEAKRAVGYVLAYARAGVFIDYPNTTKPAEKEGEAPKSGATIEEIQSGKVRPTINVVSPFNVINWRVQPDGATDKLTLVVMAESYASADDGFELKQSLQFRVLRLDKEGNYVQEVWREPSMPTEWDGVKYPAKEKRFEQFESFTPLDFNGQPMKEIPFSFLGTDNNDSNPDYPNMYDLAAMNIAHFRNSADYEESCFIMGQPTVALTGLTQQWVEDVLKGKVAFGARGGIPLPVGGDAKIIQAGENTMIHEAMEAKERQMVALGAKLVEQKTVQRTAFEAKVESTGASSTLASSANNVSSGFVWALNKALLFTGGEGSEVEFKLNTDYDIASLTPEERKQAISEWQAGAITFAEMRTALRKAGSATEDDQKAKENIAKDQAEALRMEAEANPNPGNFGE